MKQENFSDNLPNFPVERPQSRHDIRQARREAAARNPHRTRNTIGSIAAGVSIFVAQSAEFTSEYLSRSIQQGKEAVQSDHATVHEIYTYDDGDPLLATHATVVLTGLGTKNPSETAAGLSTHRDMGSVYALEYSNEGIDIEDMAQRVVTHAKERNIKELSFDGYSAGGSISLAIAARIHAHEPDLRIVSVTLNSSPIGEGSLTPHSERGIRLMDKILSTYPDLKYYKDGHILVEVLNRSERYLVQAPSDAGVVPHLNLPNQLSLNGVLYTIDFAKLQHELAEVQQKMNDPDAASASLIESQAHVVKTIDSDTHIRTLSRPGANKGHIPVKFIATRSKDAGRDAVVDVDTSEDNAVLLFEKHGASYTLVRASVGHANPAEQPKEYRDMKRSRINPVVTESLALGALASQLPKQQKSEK